MNQSILAVFDLDDTLLASPKQPLDLSKSHWWYHPRSFDGIESPGFDPRWNLKLLQEARRMALRDDTYRVVLCTGRPDTREMRQRIMQLVYMMDIPFTHVQLKPVTFGGSTAEYKATAILDWTEELPLLRKVCVWDDDDENLAEVHQTLTEEGIDHEITKVVWSI